MSHSVRFPSPPRRRVTPSVLSLLEALGQDVVSASESVRLQHAQGETHHDPQLPDLVFFARTVEAAQAAVRICAEARIPVIPFGTGTSVEGGISAPYGGVCIDVSQMNRILRISEDDMDVTVEAGVTRKQLNTAIRDTGLFFPIDPGADASIGGMTSTRASGTNAVRYGTMRENVLGVSVVLADGTLLHAGGRARKSSAGYDLTRLFCGAEGTLGVIVDVSLRLHGLPETIVSGVAPFASIDRATESVMSLIRQGIPLARVELLDEVQIAACNRYSHLTLEERPTLFFEFHGSPASVEDQVARTGEIIAEYGAGRFEWAAKAEDRNRLWEARHNAYYAILALRPGLRGWSSDTCAPISKLTQLILAAKDDIAAFGLTASIVGHVGDGNFHTIVGFDPQSQEERALVSMFNERLVERSIAAGGTCTGEHGIGMGKVGFLEREHPTGVPAMRRIKDALDPFGIMNPGKVIRLIEPH